MPLIDDGLLPANFTSNHGWSCAELREDSNCKWYARARRNCVKFGAYLCRINFRQNFYPDRKNCAREPLWSDALYYFNYYFTLKLMLAIYHQYVLDYHKYKLARFDAIVGQLREAANLTSVQLGLMQVLRRELVANIGEAELSYKAMGAPYMRMSYVLPSLYIYYILIIAAVYVLPQFYYKYWRPFDYSIMYTINAPHRLQVSINALICDRVNNFIESCRMYNQILIDRTLAGSAPWGLHMNDWPGAGSASPEQEHAEDETDLFEKWRPAADSEPMRRANAGRIARNHTFLVSQVKCMARTGALQPLNRRKDRVARTADILSLISVGLLGYNLVWLTMLMCFGHAILETTIETDPMDLLFCVELYVYSATILSAFTFYTTLMAVLCLDQVYAASELSVLIERCISGNCARLVDYLSTHQLGVCLVPYASASQVTVNVCRASIVRHPRGPAGRQSLRDVREGRPAGDERLRHLSIGKLQLPPVAADRVREIDRYTALNEAVNSALMHTLLHYKIFFKQLRPSLDTVVPVFAVLNQFVMFMPVMLVRLLLAYLDQRKKRISLLICALLMVTTALIRSMICWLHARCLRVYKHLQSLIAHTIAFNRLVYLQTGRDIYDSHLLKVLCSELNYPEAVRDRFATRYLGGQARVTYANLCWSVFWWGLIAISVYVVDSGLSDTKELFGRVWKYYGSVDVELAEFFANVTARA